MRYPKMCLVSASTWEDGPLCGSKASGCTVETVLIEDRFLLGLEVVESWSPSLVRGFLFGFQDGEVRFHLDHDIVKRWFCCWLPEKQRGV